MKEELFLKKELVVEDKLSPEGVLAYVALRSVIDTEFDLYDQKNPVSYVSINRMAYVLLGEIDKQVLGYLKKGFDELADGELIKVIQDLKNDEYIIDFTNLYLDKENNFFVIINIDDVRKILTCSEAMKKRVPMLKYYIALVSTFDVSDGVGKFKRKIGHMVQSFIAEQANISVRSCQRYAEILSNIKVLYVHKSNDKVRVDNELKQITNCYSRYVDRELCIEYGKTIEKKYGHANKTAQIETSKQNKKKSDHNRRLAQIYNQMKDGKIDYDKKVIKEVYRYVKNKNEYYKKEIESKKAQGNLSDEEMRYIEKLQANIRDLTVFDQFDFLHLTVDDTAPAKDNDIPDDVFDPFGYDYLADMIEKCEAQGEHPFTYVDCWDIDNEEEESNIIKSEPETDIEEEPPVSNKIVVLDERKKSIDDTIEKVGETLARREKSKKKEEETSKVTFDNILARWKERKISDTDINFEESFM